MKYFIVVIFVLIFCFLSACENRPPKSQTDVEKKIVAKTIGIELPKQKYKIVENAYIKKEYIFYDNESKKNIIAQFGLLDKELKGKKLFLMLFEKKEGVRKLINIFYYYWQEDTDKLILIYNSKYNSLEWGRAGSEVSVIIKWNGKEYVQYPIKATE